MKKTLDFIQEIGTIMYVGGILSHIVIGIVIGHPNGETAHTVYVYKELSAYILILPGLGLKIACDLYMYFVMHVRAYWLKGKMLMMIFLSANAFIFLVPMMPELVELARQSPPDGPVSQAFLDKLSTEKMVGQSNIIPLILEIVLGSFRPGLFSERTSSWQVKGATDMQLNPVKLILPLFCMAALSACQKPEPEAELETIRPIKTVTLSDRVQAVQERRFAGVVQAAESSTLSFEVAGKILKIHVDAGDQVKKGQLLAAIDDEPFKLDLQSAEADLKKAKASYKNEVSSYKRKSELSEEGYVSASEMDQALAERDSARNQVTILESQLDLAKRNLRKTKLKAPFGGYISRRLLEPFQEITSGQSLFQLDQLDVVEVAMLLPENVIGHLKVGNVGVASFNSLKGIAEGRIAEIGTQAEAVNSFPVSLKLNKPPAGLLPGMTAEVEFQLEQSDQGEGYLLPATAIVAGMGTGSGKHFVFTYDPDSSTVRKKAILIGGGQNNMARVIQGLQDGDKVAIAGASFLSDGMKVRLLETP